MAAERDAATTNALRDRADLVRARKDIENAQTGLKFAGNQRLPDVRVNASYLASGLGGTQVLRTGGFPGTIQYFEIELEPCYRYYLNAQFDGPVGADWRLVVDATETIPNCPLPGI